MNRKTKPSIKKKTLFGVFKKAYILFAVILIYSLFGSRDLKFIECPVENKKIYFWEKLFWQKYTNTKYNYSFRYPIGVKINASGNVKIGTAADQESSLISIVCLPDYQNINIVPPDFYWNKVEKYSNLKEYVVVLENIKDNKVVWPGNELHTILLFEELVVDGKPAIKLRYKLDADNDEYDNGQVFEIVYIETSPRKVMTLSWIKNKNEDDQMIYQILETLEF